MVFLRGLHYPFQIHDTLSRITLDASTVTCYAGDNGLSLNLAKSKVLIMGSSRCVTEIYSSHLPPIVVNEMSLPFVSEATNRGVVFRSDLFWRGHITLISRKVTCYLHKPKHHRNPLSEKLNIELNSTLIFPFLEYCLQY